MKVIDAPAARTGIRWLGKKARFCAVSYIAFGDTYIAAAIACPLS